MAKKKTNPYMQGKWLWMWFFLAPVMIFVSSMWDANQKAEEKRRKKAKKDAEFRNKYPEWWFYSD